MGTQKWRDSQADILAEEDHESLHYLSCVSPWVGPGEAEVPTQNSPSSSRWYFCLTLSAISLFAALMKMAWSLDFLPFHLLICLISDQLLTPCSGREQCCCFVLEADNYLFAPSQNLWSPHSWKSCCKLKAHMPLRQMSFCQDPIPL